MDCAVAGAGAATGTDPVARASQRYVEDEVRLTIGAPGRVQVREAPARRRRSVSNNGVADGLGASACADSRFSGPGPAATRCSTRRGDPESELLVPQGHGRVDHGCTTGGHITRHSRNDDCGQGHRHDATADPVTPAEVTP